MYATAGTYRKPREVTVVVLYFRPFKLSESFSGGYETNDFSSRVSCSENRVAPRCGVQFSLSIGSYTLYLLRNRAERNIVEI